MERRSRITGIISTSNVGVLTFVLDDFKLTILPPVIYTGNKSVKEFIIKADENGFVQGQTYSGHHIAFYVGIEKNLTFYTETIIKLSVYFITNGNINNDITNKVLFEGCLFKGDIIDYISSRRNINDDLFDFNENINIDNIDMILNIFNNTKESTFSDKSTKCTKVDSNIQFIFNEAKGFDILFNCYLMMSSICQFMNFNKNNFLTEFDILQKHEEPLEEYGYFSCATCYINLDINNDTLNTGFDYILLLEKMNKEQIVKLFKMFSVENKKNIYTNFLPKDYDDMPYFDVVKVKEICAALECECGYIKFDKNNKNELMTKIKNDINDLVKEYKKTYPFEQYKKVYSMVSGSIGHWDLTLADKLDVLHKIYDERIFLKLDDARKILWDFNKNDICSFVKVRNNNSHGNFNIVSEKIAKTSSVMIALIYCSILERIGLDDEQIIYSVKTLLKRFT